MTSTCTAFGGSFRFSHWTISIGESSGAHKDFPNLFRTLVISIQIALFPPGEDKAKRKQEEKG